MDEFLFGLGIPLFPFFLMTGDIPIYNLLHFREIFPLVPHIFIFNLGPSPNENEMRRYCYLVYVCDGVV